MPRGSGGIPADDGGQPIRVQDHDVAGSRLDETLQAELREVMEIQWRDNTKARVLDNRLRNQIAHTGKKPVRSQEAIRAWLERAKR